MLWKKDGGEQVALAAQASRHLKRGGVHRPICVDDASRPLRGKDQPGQRGGVMAGLLTQPMPAQEHVLCVTDTPLRSQNL